MGLFSVSLPIFMALVTADVVSLMSCERAKVTTSGWLSPPPPPGLPPREPIPMRMATSLFGGTVFAR